MCENNVKLNDYGYPIIKDKIKDPREVQQKRVSKYNLVNRIKINIVKIYHSLKRS